MPNPYDFMGSNTRTIPEKREAKITKYSAKNHKYMLANNNKNQFTLPSNNSTIELHPQNLIYNG